MEVIARVSSHLRLLAFVGFLRMGMLCWSFSIYLRLRPAGQGGDLACRPSELSWEAFQHGWTGGGVGGVACLMWCGGAAMRVEQWRARTLALAGAASPRRPPASVCYTGCRGANDYCGG